MATVPTYHLQAVPSVGTGLSTGGGFAASIASASKADQPDLRGFEHAGKELVGYQKQINDQFDEARVTEAENQLKQFAIDQQNGDNGYFKLKGKDAITPDGNGSSLLDRTMQDLTSRSSEISSGLNARQRELFGKRAQAIQTWQYGAASQHMFQEGQRHAVNQHTHGIELAGKVAAQNYKNPLLVAQQVERAKEHAAAIAQINGMDEDGARLLAEKSQSAVLKNAITLALGDAQRGGSTAPVSTMVEKYKGVLDAQTMTHVRNTVYAINTERQALADADKFTQQMRAPGGMAAVAPQTGSQHDAVAVLGQEKGASYSANVKEFGGDSVKAVAASITSAEAVKKAEKEAPNGAWITKMPQEAQKQIAEATEKMGIVTPTTPRKPATAAEDPLRPEYWSTGGYVKAIDPLAVRAAIEAGSPRAKYDRKYRNAVEQKVLHNLELARQSDLAQHSNAMSACMAAIDGNKPVPNDALGVLNGKERLALDAYRAQVERGDKSGDPILGAKMRTDKGYLGRMTQAEMEITVRGVPGYMREEIRRAWGAARLAVDAADQAAMQMAEAAKKGELQSPVKSEHCMTLLSQSSQAFRDMKSQDDKFLLAGALHDFIRRRYNESPNLDWSDKGDAVRKTVLEFNRDFIQLKNGDYRSVLTIKPGDLPNTLKSASGHSVDAYDIVRAAARQISGNTGRDPSDGEMREALARLFFDKSIPENVLSLPVAQEFMDACEAQLMTEDSTRYGDSMGMPKPSRLRTFRRYLMNRISGKNPTLFMPSAQTAGNIEIVPTGDQ